MADSLKFGTSGLRGLATELVGEPARRYAAAFARHVGGSGPVLVGRDLRASSPEIAASVASAITGLGREAVDCGALPTPALALAAMRAGAPAIMVTGSHIPADRNGLKFYLATGEIGKDDEAGILRLLGDAPARSGEARIDPTALGRYRERYRRVLPAGALAGLRIGVWQHSSVARDLLGVVLDVGGAEVVALGRSEVFVPVDTEAISSDMASELSGWVRSHQLDAVVSADGDGDRPLVVDERGAVIRGDVLGILTANFVHGDVVVTPVTSNSSIEGTGLFKSVVRTKVGSPYVIAGMEAARRTGAGVVVGFEANGGLLLGSDVTINGATLTALPTRDALLPILCVLGAARASGQTLSQLVATLPPRVARSDRLEHVPAERSARLMSVLREGAKAFFAPEGTVAEVSDVDGLRFVLSSGDVVHYRPSGNAPELRCYTEAASADRANALLAWGLKAAAEIVRE